MKKIIAFIYHIMQEQKTVLLFLALQSNITMAGSLFAATDAGASMQHVEKQMQLHM